MIKIFIKLVIVFFFVVKSVGYGLWMFFYLIISLIRV